MRLFTITLIIYAKEDNCSLPSFCFTSEYVLSNERAIRIIVSSLTFTKKTDQTITYYLSVCLNLFVFFLFFRTSVINFDVRWLDELIA